MSMDFRETNQVLKSKVHDFDLNIAYVEDFDVNPKNDFSSPILLNIQQASQNNIEKMKIEDAIANKGKKENEVQESSEVVDTAIQTNSAAEGGVTLEDMRQVEPKYIASLSFAPPRISQRPPRHRHRHRHRHHRGEAKQSTDPDRFCTNFYCKTRRTPMWRKGPLGPKTLCNACGLQYLKTVKGTGSGLPASVSDEGDGGASPGPVPAETLEGDSDL